jgi:hypothetical protein
MLGCGAASAMRCGATRQPDLQFGRLRLGFGEIESGFRLIHFRLVFARVDLEQQIAFPDVHIVVDRQRNDVTGDLGGDGCDIRVDLRIVG